VVTFEERDIPASVLFIPFLMGPPNPSIFGTTKRRVMGPRWLTIPILVLMVLAKSGQYRLIRNIAFPILENPHLATGIVCPIRPIPAPTLLLD
jgi:hypothetical protein